MTLGFWHRRSVKGSGGFNYLLWVPKLHHVRKIFNVIAAVSCGGYIVGQHIVHRSGWELVGHLRSEARSPVWFFLGTDPQCWLAIGSCGCLLVTPLWNDHLEENRSTEGLNEGVTGVSS